MRPHVSASPPPISVGNDDDGDDGANDVEEDNSIDGMIGRSVGKHASAQHEKGQRGNDVGLGFGLGLCLRNGTGEDTNTNLDSTLRSARPPCLRIHLRTASHSPSSTQSMASSIANTG